MVFDSKVGQKKAFGMQAKTGWLCNAQSITITLKEVLEAGRTADDTDSRDSRAYAVQNNSQWDADIVIYKI